MNIRFIQDNILHIVPAEGKYLIRQGNEKNPSGMHEVTQVDGPKCLVTLPGSVYQLQKDSAIWSKVINKDQILNFPAFPPERFFRQVHDFLEGLEDFFKTQNVGNKFIVITCDMPEIILDLVSSLEDKKKWWQFWKWFQ